MPAERRGERRAGGQTWLWLKHHLWEGFLQPRGPATECEFSGCRGHAALRGVRWRGGEESCQSSVVRLSSSFPARQRRCPERWLSDLLTNLCRRSCLAVARDAMGLGGRCPQQQPARGPGRPSAVLLPPMRHSRGGTRRSQRASFTLGLLSFLMTCVSVKANFVAGRYERAALLPCFSWGGW